MLSSGVELPQQVSPVFNVTDCDLEVIFNERRVELKVGAVSNASIKKEKRI